MPGERALSRAVLAWGEANCRDLPWRRTRDPWAVLVSELMLQQTQVARVCGPYRRFLTRFPTPADCAGAEVGEVVRLWAGLGYNRRAVNLHRAAVACVARHQGTLPSDLGSLLELPGVGPYTARAVLAFAFEEDVGVVDTNAARVLRRTSGRALGAQEVQARADELVPRRRGWAWNQAILDLGATMCTARAPRCRPCPVRHWCAWNAAARPDPDPAASTARQSRFAGSDREGRGKLVAALRDGPVGAADVARSAGWSADPERAWRVARALVADGLAVLGTNGLRLP